MILANLTQAQMALPTDDVMALLGQFNNDLMQVSANLTQELPVSDVMILLQNFGAEVVQISEGALTEEKVMELAQ